MAQIDLIGILFIEVDENLPLFDRTEDADDDVFRCVVFLFDEPFTQGGRFHESCIGILVDFIEFVFLAF